MSVGKFATSTLSLDDLRMEFRNYKLKSLNNEIQFNILPSSVEENYDLLIFITENFPDDIITGSLGLKLLGLISRKSNDIDILIKDKNRYSNYNLNDYGDDEFTTPNRLGFVAFNYKKDIISKSKEYIVDFFEDKNVPYLEFEIKVGPLFHQRVKKIKIHNPLEIMDYKLTIFANPKVVKYVGRKHNEDLTRIFGQAPWQLILDGQIKV